MELEARIKNQLKVTVETGTWIEWKLAFEGNNFSRSD